MKLTKEQRLSLLEAHRSGGLVASRALAKEYGCTPRYGYELAKKAGDKPAEDPRWSWARERGAVCA